MKLNPIRTGVIVGVFAGVMHIIWSTIMVLGLGQAWLDFIFSLHFLNNPLEVNAFDLTTAVTLVAVTAAVGFGVGNIFAHVWNNLTKR